MALDRMDCLRKIWERMWGRTPILHTYDDNQAMIKVCETGRNPTMKQLQRTHGVNVTALHEAAQRPDVDLQYIKSADQRADIYTKAFTDADKWLHACWLVNIVHPDVLEKCIQHVTYEEQDVQWTPDAKAQSSDLQPSYDMLAVVVNSAPMCKAQAVARQNLIDTCSQLLSRGGLPPSETVDAMSDSGSHVADPIQEQQSCSFVCETEQQVISTSDNTRTIVSFDNGVRVVTDSSQQTEHDWDTRLTQHNKYYNRSARFVSRAVQTQHDSNSSRDGHGRFDCQECEVSPGAPEQQQQQQFQQQIVQPRPPLVGVRFQVGP